MLSLFMDEHSGCSKHNRKEMTKQHLCICNAIQEGKASCLSSLIHGWASSLLPIRVIVTVLDKP
jgi:hypothetical protein